MSHMVEARISINGEPQPGCASCVQKAGKTAAHIRGAAVHGAAVVGKKGFSKGLSLGNAFKDFLIRGNMIDLVVAVVVGGAFTQLINSFVADLITPTIAAIFGKPDFSRLQFTINHSAFTVGKFFNALLSFMIVSFVMFFMVVIPMQKALFVLYQGRFDTKKCPECCEKVPATANKCKFCCSVFSSKACAEEEEKQE